jgi:signal transduction histidine kinase
MAYRRSATNILAVAGTIAASAFTMDSFMRHLWIGVVYGALICGAGAKILLARLSADPVAPPAAGKGPSEQSVLMSAYVDQGPVPLLSYSDGEGLVAINRAARSLFGTDDLVGDPPPSLTRAIAQSPPAAPGPLSLFGKSYAIGISEIVTVRESVKLVSLVDIQSEIRMAEATALRDLLRVLSHEIMNSLTPVSNLADLARDYLADETPAASKAAGEALDLLSQRAAGLAHFVEAYRTLARLPDPVLRTVDLGLLLRDIVRVFEKSIDKASVHLEVDLPAGPLLVDLDETLLSQALLNILTNAAEAVTVSQPGRIRVSVIADESESRILVSDNGCGVPDELSAQIFHAFVTTKPDGTGTGLNLARQIALAHGGDLLFVGRDEPWSTIFAFILPRHAQDPG